MSSPSSNEESATTPEHSLRYAISIPPTPTILSDLFRNNQLAPTAAIVTDTSSATVAAATVAAANHVLNRHICNDLRVSANKSFSQNVRTARPYLPPRHIDGTSMAATSPANSFENRLCVNRLSEKRQSDPQIRYAFYNRGFEVASASTKQCKYSRSHDEVRRKAMPDIDEYEACENSDNDDDDDDEWQQHLGLRQNLQHLYTGSSGRDITLLPKLKIRILDEMGARIQQSTFDNDSASASSTSSSSSSFSCDGSTTAPPPPPTPTDNDQMRDESTMERWSIVRNSCSSQNRFQNTSRPDRHHSTVKPVEKALNTAVDASPTPAAATVAADNDISICKKCGHKLKIKKQFTNTFTKLAQN